MESTIRFSDVLLILIAILFPPASAAIVTGCSCALMLNILLTILGYIPGHLHAFWLIYKKIQAEERYGPQGYVYVSQGVYEPIGGPDQATNQFAVQAPYQGASGPEIYAGQGSYHSQGQHVQQGSNKGAPPPYGAV
ncbi:hypothetical protein P389DRAFT_211586 [Cystobasidium minutum MCA 4210]|uniref:uncharacterized protein n=1 Tax=Cystobasidium minutum MCA 4210 TaxID=1397322 RepID=UPI0034CED43D|eukprot:jgi/Rhomi1/211586/estExt_Genemark1.C_5_t10113